MNPSEKCRVDGCDRRAAASVVRDSLPGPLPLCLTHTEDFRMNNAGWTIIWENSSAEPTSVTAAAVAAVGHSGPRLVDVPPSQGSLRRGVRSRLEAWQGRRST